MKTEFRLREGQPGKVDELVAGQVCLVDCGGFRCAAYLDAGKVWRNCYTGERVRVVKLLGGIGRP